MEMDRPRREDEQQMEHTSSRLAGDHWSRSAKDKVLWKTLEKAFNSIGLAHL